MRVVNSSMFGSSFFPGFCFDLLTSFLNCTCEARTSEDISIAIRDAAREEAERIMTMVNLDSFMTWIVSFPSVIVSVLVA